MGETQQLRLPPLSSEQFKAMVRRGPDVISGDFVTEVVTGDPDYQGYIDVVEYAGKHGAAAIHGGMKAGKVGRTAVMMTLAIIEELLRERGI